MGKMQNARARDRALRFAQQRRARTGRGMLRGRTTTAAGTAVSLERSTGFEQAEISGDDYFSDGGRRGAGTERQPPFRPDGQGKDGEGTRPEPAGWAQQRHRGRGQKRAAGSFCGADIFLGLARQPRPRSRKSGGFAARGGENDSGSRQLARYIADVWPLLHQGRGRQAHTVCSGWTGICAAATILRSISRDLPQCASRSSARISTTSIRTCAPRTAWNMADLPKFVDFDYVARVARLNAASLASLASAPAPPANVRLLTKDLDKKSTMLTW